MQFAPEYSISPRFLCGDYSPFFFFFNDTATTEIYTLSLHDALPISLAAATTSRDLLDRIQATFPVQGAGIGSARSEEHTSELQSLRHLVCRLLLEKKNREQHEGDLYVPKSFYPELRSCKFLSSSKSV